MSKIQRRRFLQASGAVLVAGAFAGCNDENGDPDPNGDDPEPDGDPAPDDVDAYLSDNNANLYDGTIEDETGQDSITIMNGAGDNGLAYDPPAVRIDAGTTVTWEWTGEGGAHNVVSADESDFEFESDDGQLIDEAGHTFEFTFDEPGTAFYICTAHAAVGQHGAIVVE